MRLLLDSFWRALAYCLQPRVIALSLLPLVLLVAGSTALFWLFWEPAVAQMQAWLAEWALMDTLARWFDTMALGHLRAVMAPLLLILLVLPLMIALALLAVAWLVTPAVVRLVSQRRFPALEARHGGHWWGSVAQSLGATVLALLALLLTLPLWAIPPLVLVLPPLIWGWLATRVMVYDTLAQHASAEERQELVRRHRYALLFIGVVTGYLGAAPAMIWAIGVMAVVLAPLLVPLALWIYTFIFIFSALWFCHYTLAALAALRAQAQAPAAPATTQPDLLL
jgi:hypothetical protein